MTIRCKQCSFSPIEDFSAPVPTCPRCGIAINDKTIEIIDESGRPTPKDFELPRSEVLPIFLGVCAATLFFAWLTYWMYGDFSEWEQTGEHPRRLKFPFWIAYQLGGPAGIAAIPGFVTALIGAYAVHVGIDLIRAPSEVKPPESNT